MAPRKKKVLITEQVGHWTHTVNVWESVTKICKIWVKHNKEETLVGRPTEPRMSLGP